MLVKQIRNKILTKEAVQWLPETQEEVLQWLRGNGASYSFHEINSAGQLIIYTLEGPYQVGFTWWIIKGIKNEFYPCEPNIFAESYEILEPNQTDQIETSGSTE